jgi:glutathione synthase/RimK-type ligase-like ATP-grasp enzyme
LKRRSPFIESLKLAPVVFQELIPADYDLRVTVVGRAMFAARIFSQHGRQRIDWRVDIGMPMERVRLPEDLAKTVLQYMQLLDLDYGALDFRVTPDGKTVFFELNPLRHFLFCEEASEPSITDAMCDLLTSAAERHRPATSTALPTARNP